MEAIKGVIYNLGPCGTKEYKSIVCMEVISTSPLSDEDMVLWGGSVLCDPVTEAIQGLGKYKLNDLPSELSSGFSWVVNELDSSTIMDSLKTDRINKTYERLNEDRNS